VTRLRGSYALVLATALLALCPDLVLSTGLLPSAQAMTSDLGTSQTAIQVANGLSNAAFAVGVVLAAQLSQRFVQRELFLAYAATFVLGSVLAAAASGSVVLMAARILQGGSTGLMMIAALPPLITRFGVGRLPWSVASVNLGLFGATTLGPLVGGAVAGNHAWRTLFWVVAAVGALNWLVALVGYPVFDAPDPGLQIDRAALLLAAMACLLTFLASSVIASVSLASALFWLPFVAGLAAVVVLIVVESRKAEPLMPVRELSTQLPVTGTLVAMFGGAAFVTVVELVQLYLASVAKQDPTTAGLLFWPMPVGLAVAAGAFGLLFSTRYLAVLVNVGLLALTAGCVLLLWLPAGGGTWPVPAASALLGFGAGATVTPGLFLAGMGVRSERLGRAFALVQLLRLTATFAVGPLVLYVVKSSSSPAGGVHTGVWITVGISLLGLVLSLLVPALSGARLRKPDLRGWLEDGEQALVSPRTAAGIRPGVDDETARPVVPGALRRRG